MVCLTIHDSEQSYDDETCKNDGNHASYIETNGWLHSSKDVCCKTHFNYAYDVCMNDGNPAGPTNLYFADFMSGKCLQDCHTGPFGCAQVPPPIVLYDTIEGECSSSSFNHIRFDCDHTYLMFIE